MHWIKEHIYYGSQRHLHNTYKQHPFNTATIKTIHNILEMATNK